MGDFNIQIGKEIYYRDVAEKFSLHEITNNKGERQQDTKTNLKISSIQYQHKTVHKMTWLILGRNTSNQIDHILITEKRAAYITDVSSYRGTSLQTGHCLVIAKIRQKVMKEKKQKIQEQKWAVEMLENEQIRKEYRKEINEN
ncbi:hypothetical protein ILUMI_10971 [Ignelater luminosus]|uniref:Uncharacterized protein n=1 Tax=Ignelater luminosus TaxID=2038154 RepID=A0A8K0GD47_IGNLU|nr:hypothetical protein ILUMI_10971 [Ignelater luminosus]